MALDEALLDAVAADPQSAYIRTYQWSTPTLSLGYFQHVAEAEAEPRWRGLPWVRRPTGGGAILHDREITYAVVVPARHPLARPSTALYRAVHQAFRDLLAALGLSASLRPGNSLGEPAAALASGEAPRLDRRPFLCFLDPAEHDVIADGAKIVGSAQRRRGGAVLQHGSVLLSRSAYAEELPGLRDLSRLETTLEPLGLANDESNWPDRLTQTIASALSLRPKPASWGDPLLGQARCLEKKVYSDPNWTRRR
jgi:lipoate-protein ligase A